MALKITTTSSKNYLEDRANAIYPAFADNMPYESWSPTAKLDFFQLAAEGGSGYAWEILNGTLPPGLSMYSNGRIFGTPLKEGTYNFVVKVVSGKESATKALTFVVHPFRAQRMVKAKFGAYLNCGMMSEPRLVGAENIPVFEARTTKFNANEWVKAIKDMGCGILNYSAFSGDSVRMWPSTTPTQKEFKTKRNYLQELITACRAGGIMIEVYFAPDSIANGRDAKNADPSNVSGWHKRNVGLIRELSLMDIDGLWIDVGATDPSLYEKGAIEPDFFPWDEIAPIVRHNNPFITIAVNPGTAAPGNLWKYPLIDVVLFEGSAGTLHPTTLITAVPCIMQKKMAIQAVNILDTSFSWQTSQGIPHTPAKSTDAIIKNIKDNWAAGATYMLNWPVPPSGEVIHPAYKEPLKKIGAFVKASIRNKASGTNNFVRTAHFSARIHSSAKGQIGQQKTSVIAAPVSKKVAASAANARAAAENSTAKETSNYYRGMYFTVGEKDMIVNAIGRKFSGTSRDHELLIKKYWNDFPILSDVLKRDDKEENGFQYAEIPPLILKAGMTYYVAFKENQADEYYAHTFKQNPTSPDFTILGNMILNPNGDRKPVVQDGIGQLINFKYTLAENKTGNIALGKPIWFQHSKSGKILNPNAAIYYAFNATDGDSNSYAQASGDYQFVTVIDLLKDRMIKKVVVDFHNNGYATSLRVDVGKTMNEPTQVGGKENNNATHVEINFNPTSARFVFLKILKPDGPNQPGNAALIGSIGIF
ncbi:Ig domain-containing protein [Dyadobacter sp. CY326]|uniref:Ig domain-containing protein n=1 Tax=Dyadobacter sp. CY326 TaxID=2907300 RepID=UPI001F3736D8|nr:Ig domain-containing protein [Dyadobacter sp. CY326]MCE7065375.1 alpha-L-fucosidase [Dyadobacter sp. CY326]